MHGLKTKQRSCAPDKKKLPGRPRKLSARQERLFLRHITTLREEDGNFTVKRLMEKAGLKKREVSCRTVQRFLHSNGYCYLNTKLLVHAFVTSHLDYCNSLLFGLPAYQQERLQKVLNAAARVICFIPKYDHITPSLIKLHWLPVKQRIEFKIALLVFKAVNGLSPVYLTNLLQIQPTRRYKLRSDDKELLFIQRSKSKPGDHAFTIAGPRIWNDLPLDIRLSANLETF